jgi:hypothetical protein
MAAELCRVSLWLEALDPGKPLSFLDHRIRIGNALIGATPSLIAAGVPEEAFTALEGDDKKACAVLRKRNKAELEGMGPLFAVEDAELQMRLEQAAAALTELPEDRLEEVLAKESAFRQQEETENFKFKKRLANLWCSAFVIRKHFLEEGRDSSARGVTQGQINALVTHQPLSADLESEIDRLARQYGFFHWHLAFPEVFARGGFDLMLGNPPWERVKLQELEFFARRHPAIAGAPNKAARERMITSLGSADAAPEDKALLLEFEEAKRSADAVGLFARASGRYPLTGQGDVNTYGLFAELFKDLVSSRGHAGVIVPAELLSGDVIKEYFQNIIENGTLKSSIAFENEEFIFPGIANVNRFALISLGPSDRKQDDFTFAFYLRRPEHLHEQQRFWSLSRSDIELLNPNTKTCPVFRTTVDADLTKRIYGHVPVLVNEAQGSAGDPWNVIFTGGRMFDMATDSALFRTPQDLTDAHYRRDSMGAFVDANAVRFMPLYEGKFIWEYDHRFSSYHNLGKVKGRGGRGLPPVTLAEYADPQFVVEARYWVDDKHVNERLSPMNWQRAWLLGWRDVTSAKLERTFVTAVLPRVAAGHTLPLYFPGTKPPLTAALVANLSSLVFDYFVRQKLAGTHLTQHYFKQFPVLPPSVYTAADLEFIVPRVLELSYTSNAIQPFALDLGFTGPPFRWDPDRRAWLCAELDAYFARLYALTRDELRYILDPADVYGDDYPSETFRVLKEREIKDFGEYRTARLVLDAWDALSTEWSQMHDTFAP